MLKIYVLVFLAMLSGLSIAHDAGKYVQGKVVEGPYKTSVIKNGELSFIETGDEEFPLSLVLNTIGPSGQKLKQLVDKYDVAGSDPKVESLFFYPVKGKKNVLVLISWEITSRGAGTYGRLYQIYAYQAGERNQLMVNKLIRLDRDLSGMDGYQDGEEQSFEYKNADLIKKYIEKNVNTQ